MALSSQGVAASPGMVSVWNWVRGIVILFGFLAVGEGVAPWVARIGIPLPAAVIGLGLLWGALRLGWIKTEQIADAARSLLLLMPLLFVPAGVGAFASSALHGASGVRFVAIFALLTLLGVGGVGVVAQRWLRRGGRTGAV